MENKNSAKITFLYLLSLFTLGFLAISSGIAVFQIINKFLVDVVDSYSGRYEIDALRFAISALIVATPIYYFLMVKIQKLLVDKALDKSSEIRKWLIYFILFISAVVIISWTIGIINSFLNGELTIKFALKFLTVATIAGTVFGFYFYDIKREEIKSEDKFMKIYFYSSLGAVIVVIIASLITLGNPKQQRDIRIDEEVVRQLGMIENQINQYFYEEESLPTDLDELVGYSRSLIAQDIVNPETKEKFDYKIKDNYNYELCANFKTNNKDDNDRFYNKRWLHDVGLKCFETKINTKDINMRKTIEKENVPINNSEKEAPKNPKASQELMRFK